MFALSYYNITVLLYQYFTTLLSYFAMKLSYYFIMKLLSRLSAICINIILY